MIRTVHSVAVVVLAGTLLLGPLLGPVVAEEAVSFLELAKLNSAGAGTHDPAVVDARAGDNRGPLPGSAYVFPRPLIDPMIPVADDQSVVTEKEVAVSIALTATSPEGDPLTYTVVDVPTNGTLSGTAPDLTYTPHANYSGSDSFTFLANNGALHSNLATVSITTNAVNFIVVMADDLSTNMLQDALDAGLMPNLKSHIIDAGTTFSESFVTNALCCPSRATFLTGQYTHNHGVLTNRYPSGGVTLLDDSSTLATWLQDAGYVTGFVGRYFNGYGYDQVPDTPVDDPTYIPPGWDDWQSLVGISTYQVYDYTINDNGVLRTYGSDPDDYQTDVLTRRALDFLNDLPGDESQISVPFFLWISSLAPHSETTVLCQLPNQSLKTIRPAPQHMGRAAGIQLPLSPSFDEADIDDKAPWLREFYPNLLGAEDIGCLESGYRDRLESLLSIDDLIADVVDALQERNILGNTVLVFTSDNGYLFGEHRIANKVVAYEESIRVPLYIRSPEGIAGRTETALVINNDLAPTIAEWAGASPDIEVDGRSLVSWLDGSPPVGWRTRFFIEHFHRDARAPSLPPTFVALRTNELAPVANRQLTVYKDGSMEYYDMVVDPYQLESQHETLGDTQRDNIGGLIDRFRQCSGETCRDMENWYP